MILDQVSKSSFAYFWLSYLNSTRYSKSVKQRFCLGKLPLLRFDRLNSECVESGPDVKNGTVDMLYSAIQPVATSLLYSELTMDSVAFVLT
jgi:hypothetical protein